MKYTLFFKEATPEEYILLGGKGASLASMSAADFPVPMGFSVTTHAYSKFLEEGKLLDLILEKVSCIDCANTDQLESNSAEIRQLILDKPLPNDVEIAIKDSYKQLCEKAGIPNALPVAVRSSATAEDLPDASFAGQQDTYLWIVGEDEVLKNVRKCWASLFTARAINYRKNQNIDEKELLMSVVIQKMVNARTAGVAMTMNPINGDRSKIVIDSSWGLGEAVVSGEVTPDNFLVDKIMLQIIVSNIQEKNIEHVPDMVNKCVVIREIEAERAMQPSLTEDEVIEICKISKIIEKHYKCPQDIEWAIDADLPEGENVTLLQSRPETVWSQKTIERKALTGMEGIIDTLMNPIGTKK